MICSSVCFQSGIAKIYQIYSADSLVMASCSTEVQALTSKSQVISNCDYKRLFLFIELIYKCPTWLLFRANQVLLPSVLITKLANHLKMQSQIYTIFITYATILCVKIYQYRQNYHLWLTNSSGNYAWYIVLNLLAELSWQWIIIKNIGFQALASKTLGGSKTRLCA